MTMGKHKTVKDLEQYLLNTNGMAKGECPVTRAIEIMEALARALRDRGAVKSLTPP